MSDADTQPPDIAGMRLLHRLGGGTHGCVWLARAAGGRQVAVKVGRHQRAADGLDLLAHEAETLRRVQHPNIVQLIETAHTAGGELALVLEYAAGGPLRSVVARRGTLSPGKGALSPGETACVVVGVARALAALHARRMRHGDLSADNVVLSAQGQPILVDFVSSTDTDARIAGAWETPGWSDPAQPGTVASDVWALGALLRFCLSGDPQCRQQPTGLEGLAAEMWQVADACCAPPLHRCSALNVAQQVWALCPGTPVIVDPAADAAAGSTAGAAEPREGESAGAAESGQGEVAAAVTGAGQEQPAGAANSGHGQAASAAAAAPSPAAPVGTPPAIPTQSPPIEPAALPPTASKTPVGATESPAADRWAQTGVAELSGQQTPPADASASELTRRIRAQAGVDVVNPRTAGSRAVARSRRAHLQAPPARRWRPRRLSGSGTSAGRRRMAAVAVVLVMGGGLGLAMRGEGGWANVRQRFSPAAADSTLADASAGAGAVEGKTHDGKDKSSSKDKSGGHAMENRAARNSAFAARRSAPDDPRAAAAASASANSAVPTSVSQASASSSGAQSGIDTQLHAVVRQLAANRARAFDQASVAPLGQVDVPGSQAYAADAGVVKQLTDGGIQLRGISFDVQRIEVVSGSPGERATVQVRALVAISAYREVTPAGVEKRKVAARVAQWTKLTLQALPQGWRVSRAIME